MNYNHCSHDLQRCMWFSPYWYKQTDLPFVCYIILNTWVFSFFMQCFIQTCTAVKRFNITRKYNCRFTYNYIPLKMLRNKWSFPQSIALNF